MKKGGLVAGLLLLGGQTVQLAAETVKHVEEQEVTRISIVLQEKSQPRQFVLIEGEPGEMMTFDQEQRPIDKLVVTSHKISVHSGQQPHVYLEVAYSEFDKGQWQRSRQFSLLLEQGREGIVSMKQAGNDFVLKATAYIESTEEVGQ